jgi:uncharacterized protein YqgC (DUF456 family)
MSTATVLAAVLIAFGLVGVLLPLLPGLLLVAAGIAVWAYRESSPAGWAVLVAASVVLAIGLFAKYALPGKRLRDAGVPWITLVTGGVLGVVGFFVIPILGLPIGFVLGVYLAEFARLGSSAEAWPSTRQAVTAIGLSMLIEFGAGLIAAAIWVIGLIVT